MKTKILVSTALLVTLTVFSAHALEEASGGIGGSISDLDEVTVEAEEETAQSEDLSETQDDDNEREVIHHSKIDQGHSANIAADKGEVDIKKPDFGRYKVTPAEAIAINIIMSTKQIEQMDVDKLSLKDIAVLKKNLAKLDSALDKKLKEKMKDAKPVQKLADKDQKPSDKDKDADDGNCKIIKGKEKAFCDTDEYKKVVKVQIGQKPVDDKEEFLQALVDKLNRGESGGGSARIADTSINKQEASAGGEGAGAESLDAE